MDSYGVHPFGDPPATSDLGEMAARLSVAADALDRAARHCAAAAKVVDTGEVAWMAARMLAARGDILIAIGDLDAVALMYADQSEL